MHACTCGWLAGRLAGRLAGWQAGRLAGWLALRHPAHLFQGLLHSTLTHLLCRCWALASPSRAAGERCRWPLGPRAPLQSSRWRSRSWRPSAACASTSHKTCAHRWVLAAVFTGRCLWVQLLPVALLLACCLLHSHKTCAHQWVHACGGVHVLPLGYPPLFGRHHLTVPANHCPCPACLPAPPARIFPQEARERCAKSLGEVERRFPRGVPQLDPEEDMKIEVGGWVGGWVGGCCFDEGTLFLFCLVPLLLGPEEDVKMRGVGLLLLCCCCCCRRCCCWCCWCCWPYVRLIGGASTHHPHTRCRRTRPCASCSARRRAWRACWPSTRWRAPPPCRAAWTPCCRSRWGFWPAGRLACSSPFPLCLPAQPSHSHSPTAAAR